MKSALAQRLDIVQKDAVDRAVDLLNQEGKCLIVMTTGSGKTHVAAKIIRRHHDKKILWLTQYQELIEQTASDLSNMFGKQNVGIFQAKRRSLKENIIVASIQTISLDSYLKTIPKDLFDLIVVDEAHHSRASTWQKVIQHFSANRLGLTATPERNDGLLLEPLFGDSAFTLSYDEAKEMKLIASEVYRLVLTNSVLEGVITKTGAFAPSALDRLVISENRNSTIVDSYVKYGRTFMRKRGLPTKAICFCISVKHAHRMKEAFNNFGIKSDVLLGEGGAQSTSETRTLAGTSYTRHQRKKIYNAFLDGSGVEVLCTVNVLNEGKNIPDVGCLLLARPTRSRIIFQQQIGRGCRRIEGKKEDFLVLDFVDMMNQKYPPMTLSRISESRLEPQDFILDYYSGSDPLIVDKIIEYTSPDLSFYPENKWTKAKIESSLLEFYEKHGKISTQDLFPGKTGLPARTTITNFWPTTNACFKELGIPFREKGRLWTKDEVAEELKRFLEKHGKLGIADLGRKNDLPSQRVVQKFWGTWNKCEADLALASATEWTKKKILMALRRFNKKHGRAPYHLDLRSKNGMPNIYVIKKYFENLDSAVMAAGNISRTRPKSGLPKGVWRQIKGGRSFYRTEIYFKGKRHYLGDYRTPEEARAAYVLKSKELGKKVE